MLVNTLVHSSHPFRCGAVLAALFCVGCTVSVPNQGPVGTGPTRVYLPPGVSSVKGLDSQLAWRQQAYVSTEPTNSLAPSVTITRDSTNQPVRVRKQGNQQYVTVSASEFACLEALYYTSFMVARKSRAPSRPDDLPFELFFHGAPPHSDTIFTSNAVSALFLHTLLATVNQEPKCLSPETKEQVTQLIQHQLAYVSSNN